MVQNKAILFISSLRERVSISEKQANLKLETLAERRKKSRHYLLIQLLSHGENHRALVSSYDKLMRRKDVNATVTRAAFRGDQHQYMLKPLHTSTASFPELSEN